MKITPILFLFLLFAAGSPALRADSLPDPATKNQCPPVAYVQGMIWKRLDLTSFTLNGSVRSDKTKQRYPIVLRTAGHTQEYDFTDQPLQIRVRIDPGNSVVERRTSPTGAWAPVTGAARLQPILGSDLTYEDLAVDFVNWDATEPLGVDSIKTLKAYVYEAHACAD